MSRRPLTGRADLLLALASEEEVVADVAERLGFERVRQLPEPVLVASTAVELELDEGWEVELAPRPPVPFWRAEAFSIRQITPVPPPPPPGPDDGDTEFEVTLSRFDPLATLAEVLTRLRQVADLTRPGGRIDVDRVVFEISRGWQLTEIPRLNRRSWGQDLHVVIDLARRLVPYRRDQRMVGRAMKRLLPKGGGTVSVLREGSETPVIEWPDDQAGRELNALAGATVLVLSDLGTLQDGKTRAAEARWMRIGRKLVDRECAALALIPCRPDVVPSQLARLWTLIPWERWSWRRPTPSDEATIAARQRILALLSPAARIEPRLLRAVRKLLPEGRRDPGLESKVWQMCQGTTHCSAAALTKEQVAEFRDALLNDDLNRRAWALIEAAHRDEYPGVANLEVINLGDQASCLGAAKHVERSRNWIRGIGEGEEEFGDDFFRMAADQFTREAWESLPELHALWDRYCDDDATPDGYDPALAGVDAPLQTVRVSQVGDRLEYRRQGAAAERSSPLATVRLKNPRIVVDEFDDWLRDDDDPDALWLAGEAPAWADRWGRDEIGPWVEFVIDGVRQRMRWIPAGEFLMGSPEKPEVEYGPETPRQPVTISRGFWMFDTTCTQSLWRAVMAENPSHFKGDSRPVEQVSWDDCRQFLSRVNERCPGLGVNLPTEAEWEYACRAGTDTPTYAGDRGLEQIAWYHGNAGGETHGVAQLQPNVWGLSDMLGNVWEWCRDNAHRPYSRDPVTDPVYEKGSTSAYRVIRGGCWRNPALYVRAASRSGRPPGARYAALGFRCSSSGNEPGRGGRRPVVRSQRAVRGLEREAELRGDREPVSEDRGVRMTTRDAEYAPVPRGPVVRIRTDLEEVFLCQKVRDVWATRAGRDRYGPWAEFSVPRARTDVQTAVQGSRQTNLADDVTQRMRWIPPGRFWMGSPEFESGRFDDEGPQHEATVSEGFWLFDTPCTQALWEAVTGQNPSKFKGQHRPVENVRWDDCRVFLSKLGEAVPGLAFQLPSETQWEYACRAGTETATYAGAFDPADEATQEDLKRIAWYGRNAENKTHAVAELQPNPWGLYDMLGNVWEWCQDRWSDLYDKERPADEPSAYRVIRGGGWAHSAQRVRAAYRNGNLPGYRNRDLGFRCSSSGVR